MVELVNMTKFFKKTFLVPLLLSLNLILLIYLIVIIGHPNWSKSQYRPTGLFKHVTATTHDFTRDCATNDSVRENTDFANSIEGAINDLQWDIRDIKTSVENIESNF